MNYHELLDQVQDQKNYLMEALSPADRKRIEDTLSDPDIRPGKFDTSWEGWLRRIGDWGTVNIYHTDTLRGRRKQKVSQKQFIDKISDNELLKVFGTWVCSRLDVHKVQFSRDYVFQKGKKEKEIFLIIVDLKKDLKRAVRWWFLP
jgi:hypothetical protein